jgi:starch phosphorylase
VFSPDDPHRFDELIQALRDADDYMVTADFEDYFAAQRRVDALYERKEAWAKACIANIAGMGWFSSDRAVRTYAETIWQAPL